MEEIKEKYLSDSIEPISINSTEIILNQMKKCVCKIHIKGTKGTGFFAKIPYKNNFLSCLLTNNHVLGEDNIKDGNSISISLNNEEIFKNIKIDSKRKRYTNEILDVTIIEIYEDIDNIKDFLILDNQILNKYNSDNDENNINYFRDIYEKESIYLLNYINGKEMFASYGLLSNIEENKIKHKCNTDTGSSGSPILLLKSNKVIGIHYGSSSHNFQFNFGTLILKPILEFQEITNNFLVIKKNNDSKNIPNKNISNKIENKSNKEENNLNPKINNINNNINNDIINKNKNNELKIDEKKEYTVFEKFENLLAMIIQKNEINNKDIEEFKKLSEKFIMHNFSVVEITAKYFSDIYGKMKLDENKKEVAKIIKINKEVFEILEEIEEKIKEKKYKEIKFKKKYKDERIEKFRKNYDIRNEDATDKEIIELLNFYNNNENLVYQRILRDILMQK